jgi:hypothetical protein
MQVGGLCSNVGHVLRCTNVGDLAGTRGRCAGPLCFFNGMNDTVMDLQWVIPTIQKLVDSDVNNLVMEVVKDAGHNNGEEEGVWITSFLARIIEGSREQLPNSIRVFPRQAK